VDLVKRNEDLVKRSDEKDKKHSRRVDDLKKEMNLKNDTVGSLKDQVVTLADQVDSLTKGHESMFSMVKKRENAARLRHYRFLVGSIAFNFISRVGTIVFASRWVEVRESIHSLDDIRSEVAKGTAAEQQRFARFVANWDAACEQTLKEFTSVRKRPAHPWTLEEDGDTVPSPKELIDVIETVYKQRECEDIRKHGAKIVDKLDEISRELSLPILTRTYP